MVAVCNIYSGLREFVYLFSEVARVLHWDGPIVHEVLFSWCKCWMPLHVDTAWHGSQEQA